MPENAITQKKQIVDSVHASCNKMRRTDCAYYSLAAIATRVSDLSVYVLP